jgi:hypothetical protein
LPAFNARASAFSSTKGPRLVLIIITPVFILEMAEALINPRVSAVKGQCRLMISLCRITSVSGRI